MWNFEIPLYERYIILVFNVAFPFPKGRERCRSAIMGGGKEGRTEGRESKTKREIKKEEEKEDKPGRGKGSNSAKRRANPGTFLLYPDSEFRFHNILYVHCFPLRKKNYIFCCCHSCLVPPFQLGNSFINCYCLLKITLPYIVSSGIHHLD